MLSSEMLNSCSCSVDHPSFLSDVEGPAWEDGWVWRRLSSACCPARLESSPDFSAVCYHGISDVPSSALSLQCPLHCDSVGLLEDSPTAVFLSACPHSINHPSYRVFRTLPKNKFSFFSGHKGFRVPMKNLRINQVLTSFLSYHLNFTQAKLPLTSLSLLRFGRITLAHCNRL